MNAQSTTPETFEISTAREVLVFDFDMNPARIGDYSDRAIRTMIDGRYPGGIGQFRVDHKEAIEGK